MRTEDGHIIFKCLNGDSLAFGILVDKYKESIYALAYSKLENFHDAEDVTQEVFIKAYQKLRTLKRWDSFHAWLYAITSNLCKNWIRSQSRRPDRHFVDDQSTALDYSSTDSYRSDTANESLYETLHEALDSLPEIYRQVVSLYYLGDMNTREIAKFLGASSDAIEKRLRRAREKLKEEMITMMTAEIKHQKLQVGFTFRLLEMIKQIKIQSVPRIPWVPWGIPFASGILIVVLSVALYLAPFNSISIGSLFPDVGELIAQSKTLDSGDPHFAPFIYKGEMMNYASVPVTLEAMSAISEKKSEKPETEQGNAKTPQDNQPSVSSTSGSNVGTIKGKVTDTFTPEAHNLQGVVITAENKELLANEGGKRSVKSDANGEYEIKNLPEGEYNVTVSKTGYITFNDFVTVSSGVESFHDIRMYVMGTPIPIREYVAFAIPEAEIWQGTVEVAGTKLRIIFKVKDPYGTAITTMDSPDQNLKDILVDKFIRQYDLQPEKLHIEIKSIGFVYDGVNIMKLGFPKIFKGEMKQNVVTYTLTLQKAPEPEPPNPPKHPQEPVKPYPYKEEEITYNSSGIEIKGTLTYPDSKGPFPAVILLSDYGPQDRDHLFGPGLRPFLVLADYLTRNGIAVLRTDDREAGTLVDDFYDSSYDDFAGDTLAGIQYLKGRKEINPKQIGLVSMGEGSSIALITANKSQDVAFIVMLAGVGVSGEELVMLHLSDLNDFAKNNIPLEEVTRRKEFFKRVFALMKQEKNNEVVQKKIPEILGEVTVEFSKTKLSPEEIQALKTSSGSGYYDMVTTYYRSYILYDPRQDLVKLKLPLLVINGEQNPQVPTKENFKAIEESLKKGGNKNYTLKEIPNPNDTLQTKQPELRPDQIEETISPVVLKLVGDWILERTKKK
jgi:hypothetical protein